MATLTCPNCKASLNPKAAPAAGAKVRCPKCQTAFVPLELTEAEPEVLGFAAEEDKACPACRAPMKAQAVLCVQCGFDLRKGQKLQAPKKKKGRSRHGSEEITKDTLAEVLAEAQTLIELANKELWRVPRILGLGEDPDLMALRFVGGGGRCANPNCQMGLDSGGILASGRREGTSRVTVTIRFRTVVVELCEDCTEMLLADLASRDSTARAYLNEARADLERAERRFPKNEDVQDALKDLEVVELKAREKHRLCFVATAAYGSSFAEEVETLRRYRDEVLEPSRCGRWLVRAYSALSPGLAALIARSKRTRALTRGLLRPVVWWAGWRTPQ